ncbi:MAG: MerR family transcriptional regulator [Acidobacteriota bacterium]
MKYVSNKTGLTSHTIRAWEKRYKAVLPERSAKNRRLYSESDVEKLILLRRLTLAGHSIGQIAGFSLEDLKDLIHEETGDSALPDKSTFLADSANTEKLVDDALQHLLSFDGEMIEKLMHKALAALGRRMLIEKFLIPFLEKQGEMWSSGTLRTAQEHFGSSIIRGFLANLYRESASPRLKHTLLVATPSGQRHEFGALFVAIEAAAYGWHPVYLGPDLPAEEIAAAAISNRAQVVALSIVYPDDDPRLPEELLLTRNCLSPGIRIIAGGRAVSGYKDSLEAIGALICTNMSALDHFLEQPQDV